LYDFIDDNPSVIMLRVETTNNPAIIAQNNKVTAINSAIEVDLTGQVCADSIGQRIYSGVGGRWTCAAESPVRRALRAVRRSLRCRAWERAEALISIAHPNHRESLARDLIKRAPHWRRHLTI
jgi:acyl-CoA hydrolase